MGFGRYAPVDQRVNVGFIHHAMGRSRLPTDFTAGMLKGSPGEGRKKS